MQSRLSLVIAGLFTLASLPALSQKGPQFAFTMPAMGSGDLMRQVLKRDEVQSHLHLTIKQKNDLEDLIKNPQAVKVSLEAGHDSNPEDLRRQAEEQIAKQSMASGDRIKAILKTEQYKRLEELTLQWKGALSLNNGKVATDLKLDAAHRAEIYKIMADYAMKKQEIIMASAQTEERAEGGGVARTVRIDGRKLFAPGSDSFKKLTTLKAEAEAKILGALSLQEKSAWQAAQGEPFTFRTDLPADRF